MTAPWTDWQHGVAATAEGRVRWWTGPDLEASDWRAWMLAHLRRDARDHGGEPIQVGRNVVTRQMVGGREVVLKDFGVRHVQGLIYALRSSKARRAAQAAALLHGEGFRTPEALAVAECMRGGRLRRALLLTTFIPDTVTLRAALGEQLLEPESVLPAVGRVVAALHERDLFHADLTAANVLLPAAWSDAAEEPPVHLVDINRLRRRHLDESARLRNIGQLSVPDQWWSLFFQGYAPQADQARQQGLIAAATRWHRHYRERGRRKQERKQRRRQV